jgi:imidazolonepropionase-like amidohydrolase
MQDQVGTLEVAKQGDIVLLEGNPLDGCPYWLKARTVEGRQGHG